VDAFPLCLASRDPDEIVETVRMVAPTFGGINLEDISSPRCFEIEQRLIEELDIPVFHDDQHGTAIVTLAALINACRLTARKLEELSVCMVGAGAAGAAVAKILMGSVFRGALDVRATQISEEMKLAAAHGIAGVVEDEELDEDYIIPSVFNRDVAPAVAKAVADEAERSGTSQATRPPVAIAK